MISDEFFTGFFARCGQEIDVESDARRLCFKSMVPVEANFPLFIIYTSGTTGKPKGIVHAHGYLGGVMMTMQSSFDAVPGRDVALVLASFGWITG